MLSALFLAAVAGDFSGERVLPAGKKGRGIKRAAAGSDNPVSADTVMPEQFGIRNPVVIAARYPKRGFQDGYHVLNRFHGGGHMP